LVYVQGWDTYRTAGRELDRRLKDPSFEDPESAVAKEGAHYSGLMFRNANLAMQAGGQLGSSPRYTIAARRLYNTHAGVRVFAFALSASNWQPPSTFGPQPDLYFPATRRS